MSLCYPCSKCSSKNVVYQRKYSGEYLCKKCYIYSIEEKVRHTISKYSMIKYGDTVGVGVSGGKDSLCLLYIINKLLSKKQGTKLVALTIDEGIEGYRNESLEIVKEFCKKLNVSSYTLSYSELFGIDMDKAIMTRPSKMTSCSICGTFRRRSLDVLAESVGVNVIATGHNLDDFVQTFFINMFSGDVERINWTSLASIDYSDGKLKKIKPFSEIYENEIVFYALQMDIPFQSEECPYKNESIRSDIRPFLNNLENSRPGIKYNIYKSILKIIDDKPSRKSSINTCIFCERDSSSTICSVCRNLKILKKG